MTTRNQQIEQIAGMIADNIINGLAAYEDMDVAAKAREINNTTGWTFNTSGPLTSWMRHEGVVLSETELEQAVQMAREFTMD
jgi:hypothetical protein